MKRIKRPPVVILFIGALTSLAFIPKALALNDARVNDIDAWFNQIAGSELSAHHGGAPTGSTPSETAPINRSITSEKPVVIVTSAPDKTSSGKDSTAGSTTKPAVVPLAKPVVAPLAKPAVVPLAKPAPYVEPTRFWTASAGQTLRDTITVWAAMADCSGGTQHWTVAWDTATNYRIDAPLQFSGTFKQALNEIFRLYLGAHVPLYAGTHSGQCTIKVDDKPVR